KARGHAVAAFEIQASKGCGQEVERGEFGRILPVLAQRRQASTIDRMMPAPALASKRSLFNGLRGSAAIALAISLATATTAEAAGLIRDAETEALIRTYAKPIFEAAGLGAQAIDIHVVNDRAFNAFVIDGHNMFIHAGALMDAKTPNQIIGVIAHES